MKIIEDYGFLWRLTDSEYLRLLRDGAAGKPYRLNDYGKHIGVVDHNMITDWDRERFAEELEAFRKAQREALAKRLRAKAEEGGEP